MQRQHELILYAYKNDVHICPKCHSLRKGCWCSFRAMLYLAFNPFRRQLMVSRPMVEWILYKASVFGVALPGNPTQTKELLRGLFYGCVKSVVCSPGTWVSLWFPVFLLRFKKLLLSSEASSQPEPGDRIWSPH